MSSRVAAAAEAFETNLSSVEGARRSAAASTRRNVVLEGPDGLLGGGGSGAAGSDGDGRGSSQVLPPLSPPPPPPPFSRLAALKWEDIEGRRILLHVDLSNGVVGGGAVSGDGGGWVGIVGGGVVAEGLANGSSGIGGGGSPLQRFPESVRLVAEQVREMLSAKPAAVAIVSETAPLSVATATATATAASTAEKNYAASPHHSQLASHVDPETPKKDQHISSINPGAPGAVSSLPGLESACCSLRPSAAAIASLLGMEVDFCDSVADLAAVLGRCGEGGSGVGGGEGGSGSGSGGGGRRGGGDVPFGMVPLLMVERLSLPGVVPAPPAEDPELSDGEEERLPDFSWGGEGDLSGVHLGMESAF